MLSPDLLSAIHLAATEHGLDPRLVAALVRAETEGDPWRMRFEPSYAYLKNPQDFATKLGISFKTEQTLQRMSYGPLQVMGAHARELGYTDHLPKLCILDAGLRWGCTSVADTARRFPKLEDTIAAHNAGSPRHSPGGTYVNQGYVDRVLGFL